MARQPYNANENTMHLDNFCFEDSDQGRDYIVNVTCIVTPGRPKTDDDPGYGPSVTVSKVSLLECVVWNPGRRKNGVLLDERDENWRGFKANSESWLMAEIEAQLQADLDEGNDIGGGLPVDPAYQRQAARNPLTENGSDWT